MTAVLLPSEPVETLDAYVARGGLQGIERARQLGPDQTIQELSLARLRGRGGAGFPTGTKWGSVRSAPGDVKYVVANGAEGEPGTFKDRAILRADPYQALEGAAIAALTIGAREIVIAIKGSFTRELANVERAATELAEAGIFDVPVRIVSGPDEYLFGEEKAMLEVIEGNPPLPRLLPPYQHGLYATGVQLGWTSHEPEPGTPPAQANPTLVTNVETLSNVPHILAKGAEWFRGFGTERSPGVIVCTVVGDTVRAGVGEVEMGTPLAEVIEAIGGGMPPGRTVKAVFSGVSNPVIVPADLGTPLTYEDMAAIGGGLGSCGFVVYDDTTCIVEVAELFSRFLWVESCGQCPPCKLGSEEITARLADLQAGRATSRDIEVIGARLRSVTDGARCALAGEEQAVVSSLLAGFADEFVDHLEGRGCHSARTPVMPKIVDIVDGQAVYDTRQARKRPDWTYEA